MNETLNKTLKLDLDGQEVALVIKRATTRTGIKRSLMIFAALDAHKKNEDAGDAVDEIAYVLSYRTMPDLLAGTESVEGMEYPITIEQLMELPEEFVDSWIQAIYDVNPHWNPANIVVDEDKKKKAKS